MLRVSRAKSRSRLPHQGWENSLCRQDRRRRPFQASPPVSLFQILLINFSVAATRPLCRPEIPERCLRRKYLGIRHRSVGRSLEWIKISRIKWTRHATWRWTLCAFPTFHWSPQLFPSAPTPQHHTCLSFKSMFKWHDPNMTSAKNGKSLQLLQTVSRCDKLLFLQHSIKIPFNPWFYLLRPKSEDEPPIYKHKLSSTLCWSFSTVTQTNASSFLNGTAINVVERR